MPPATSSEPYPPLPLEVDDAYLAPTHVLSQQEGLISMLVGFNANVRIYSAYNHLSTFELTYGVDEIFDWDRQTQMLEQTLRATRQILDDIPHELRLNPETHSTEARASQYLAPTQLHVDSEGTLHQRGNGFNDMIEERRRIQHEIQKANMYVSQIATRSCLVEKCWSLRRSLSSAILGATSRPNPSEIHTDTSDRDWKRRGESSRSDLTEQRMANERGDVVRHLLNVLGMASPVALEPNGASFVSFIMFSPFIEAQLVLPVEPRWFHIPSHHPSLHVSNSRLRSSHFPACWLTSWPHRCTRSGKSPPPSLEVLRTRKGEYALRAEESLKAFLDALLKLELGRPANRAERDGHTEKDGMTAEDEEEAEEAQLRHWAGLRKYPRKFAEAGGFSGDG